MVDRVTDQSGPGGRPGSAEPVVGRSPAGATFSGLSIVDTVKQYSGLARVERPRLLLVQSAGARSGLLDAFSAHRPNNASSVLADWVGRYKPIWQ
jgi:hypothetical protein